MGSEKSDKQDADIQDLWTKIYEKENEILYGYLLKRTNPELAADIFQESFLKLLQSMQKGQKIENHKAYLFTTARNFLILEYKKHQKTSQDGELPYDHYDQRENIFNDMVKKEFLEILDSARKELSETENEILELRWYYNLTQKEIAEIINKSERQIRRDLDKITLTLKNIFKASGWDESEVNIIE